jgi:hypothetical protein
MGKAIFLSLFSLLSKPSELKLDVLDLIFCLPIVYFILEIDNKINRLTFLPIDWRKLW